MFLLDYTFQILATVITVAWLLHLYRFYFKTNDVSKIDLMDLHCKHAMIVRYNSRVYEGMNK